VFNLVFLFDGGDGFEEELNGIEDAEKLPEVLTPNESESTISNE